jgi:prolyl 4-hydroxylase
MLPLFHIALILLASVSIASSSAVDVSSDGADTIIFPCTPNGSSCDTHVRCPIWKDDGECIRSPSYMKKHCPATCHNVKAEELEASRVDIAEGLCRDRHTDCPAWAALGECDVNSAMRTYCAVACGICEAEPATESDDDPSCVDEHENCGFWAQIGECDNNPNYMKVSCQKSCKTCNKKVVPQAASVGSVGKKTDGKHLEIQRQTEALGVIQSIEGEQREEVATRVQESLAYMQSDTVLELDEAVRSKCQNRHELCAFWAVIGECEKNAGYMKTNCAPSCMTCHLIDFQQRCPKLGDAVAPALYPGDLNRVFDRIVRQAPGNRTDLTDDERQGLMASIEPIYTVHIHSQPEPNMTEISAALDKSSPPWVIMLDNFLTAEECEEIIQLGYKYEYQRSADVGAEKFDGSHEAVQSERRTSENAWCSSIKGCRDEKVPTRIHTRIGKVLGIPPENSEDFQILKYEKGQF